MDCFHQDCHCKVLPTNCDVVTLCTYGVLIDNKEMENALENVVCAFLPDVPSIRIKTVTVSILKGTGLECYSEMNSALSKLKSSNFKCLLLFCNERGRRPTSALAQELKSR